MMAYVIMKKCELSEEKPYAVVISFTVEDAAKKIGLELLYPQGKYFPKPLVDKNDRHTKYNIYSVDMYGMDYYVSQGIDMM